MQLTENPLWTSESLSLFVLRESDASEAYVGWLNNPIVNQYLESRFASHTIESTREFIAQCLSDPRSVLFGIRSRALQGKHVGNIKLGPIDARHGLGEVGILIGEADAWGRGIATGAIRILTGIARDQLKLRRLTAGCYGSNLGSERAFVRAGFVVEGRRPGHFLSGGVEEDLVLLGLTLHGGTLPAPSKGTP